MDKDIVPLWLMESPNHSGMSVANRHLAAGMHRIGASPAIFALREGENAEDFALVGCPVSVFPKLGRLFDGGALRAAAERKVSVVHALSPDMVKKAEKLARKLDVPLLVTVNRLEENELHGMRNFAGQGVVAVSMAIRERIVNVAGIQQSRIRIIHNGLDLARIPKPTFSENASHTTHILRTPVIGTLGHLSAKKGQRIFLQAIKLLMERGLDAEFVVLGDGPDRTALRSLADELQVAKRVTFTPQTVTGQLTQLDILVEPSLQEGLGVSVMQAMAMGVPVVATGVGGLYDLIEDGVTGVMVPASDPPALADAIWRLLHNSSERLEMAKQAREMIEREFSADLVGQKLVEYYRECLADFHGWNGGER